MSLSSQLGCPANSKARSGQIRRAQSGPSKASRLSRRKRHFTEGQSAAKAWAEDRSQKELEDACENPPSYRTISMELGGKADEKKASEYETHEDFNLGFKDKVADLLQLREQASRVRETSRGFLDGVKWASTYAEPDVVRRVAEFAENSSERDLWCFELAIYWPSNAHYLAWLAVGNSYPWRPLGRLGDDTSCGASATQSDVPLNRRDYADDCQELRDFWQQFVDFRMEKYSPENHGLYTELIENLSPTGYAEGFIAGVYVSARDVQCDREPSHS